MNNCIEKEVDEDVKSLKVKDVDKRIKVSLSIQDS